LGKRAFESICWSVTIGFITAVWVASVYGALRHPFSDEWEQTIVTVQRVAEGTFSPTDIFIPVNINHISIWVQVFAALATWGFAWMHPPQVAIAFLWLIGAFVLLLRMIWRQQPRLLPYAAVVVVLLLFTLRQRTNLLWGYDGHTWFPVVFFVILISYWLIFRKPNALNFALITLYTLMTVLSVGTGLALPLIVPIVLWLRGYRTLWHYAVIWLPIAGGGIFYFVSRVELTDVAVIPYAVTVFSMVVPLTAIVLKQRGYWRPRKASILLLFTAVIPVVILAWNPIGMDVAFLLERIGLIITFVIATTATMFAPGTTPEPVPILYLSIFALGVGSLGVNGWYIRQRDKSVMLIPWVLMVLFALAAAAVMGVARGGVMWEGRLSRYASSNLLFWIPCAVWMLYALSLSSQDTRTQRSVGAVRWGNIAALTALMLLSIGTNLTYAINPFYGVQVIAYPTLEGPTCFYSYLITEDRTCIEERIAVNPVDEWLSDAEFAADYADDIWWLFENRHSVYRDYDGVSPLVVQLPALYESGDRVVVSGAAPQHHVKTVMAGDTVVPTLRILEDVQGAAPLLTGQIIDSLDDMAADLVQAERIWLLRSTWAETDHDDDYVVWLQERCSENLILETGWQTTVYSDVRLYQCDTTS
jgi:hypothetical protein